MIRYEKVIAYTNSDDSVHRHTRQNKRNKTHLHLKKCKDICVLKLESKIIAILKSYYNNNHKSVNAEDVAFELGYKVHYIKQVFHQLNLKGILSQKSRYCGKDNTRCYILSGNLSGWGANVYYINDKVLKWKV